MSWLGNRAVQLMAIGQLVLGRYKILDLVASGGEGMVAEAVDQRTGARVAVKQLLINASRSGNGNAVARYEREINFRIHHQVVVESLDNGKEHGAYYLIYPFVNGTDLDAFVHARGGKLSPTEAIGLLCQLAEGLAAMHRKGIVHRDLKPANILITPEGQLRLVDLGICRDMNAATITHGSSFLGSVPWMSPEQAVKPSEIDGRSDLYALGAVFYFMLTGHPVVRGTTAAEIVRSVIQDVPSPPNLVDPSVPQTPSDICMRLLQKDPNARFQSPNEVRQALGGNSPVTTIDSMCASCCAAIESNAKYCSCCGAQVGVIHTDVIRCLACGTIVGQANSCLGCHGRFSPYDHTLVFDRGALAGRTYRIPEGRYPVGRETLLARDQFISRRHFEVDCVDGVVYVQDLGSTNKTYIGSCLMDCPMRLSPDRPFWVAGNRALYRTKQEGAKK